MAAVSWINLDDAVCAEGFDLGMFRLYPTIKVEERYEDNVYLVANDPKSDFVTTVAPEIFLEGKCSGDEVFNLDYKREIINYGSVREKGTQADIVEAKMEFAGPVYSLKMSEQYKELFGPFSYRANISEYHLNDAKAAVGADYDKLSYETSMQDLDYNYQEIDSPNSYNEAIFDFAGFYLFQPKTKLLAEYKHGEIKYKEDQTKDAYYNEFLGGIKGELTKKISGTVKLGYQDRTYKAKKDWRQPVTYADVTYNISPKTIVRVNFTRSAKESGYTAENYYELNNGVFNLTQKLSAKTSAAISTEYEYDRYPNISTDARRRDHLLNMRLSLDTEMRKWLTTGASFEFKKRGSNVASYDYETNIVTVYVKGRY